MELGKPCAGKPPARFDEGSEAPAAAQAASLPPPRLLAYSTDMAVLLARGKEQFFITFLAVTLGWFLGTVAGVKERRIRRVLGPLRLVRLICVRWLALGFYAP